MKYDSDDDYSSWAHVHTPVTPQGFNRYPDGTLIGAETITKEQYDAMIEKLRDNAN